MVSSQEVAVSGWMGADRLFTTPEFQRRYDQVEIALLTPKVALVPDIFFNPVDARKALSEVTSVGETDKVEWVEVPAFSSVLVFSNYIGESLSRVLAQTVLPASGEPVRVLPELFFQLSLLDSLPEYNKIIASWMDGHLHLVIAQGKTLRLANVFEAADFTTAEYFLFLAMKKLQLNPEVSTVCFRTPLDTDAEMSLYRYFKSVVQL
ncbi:MAG: DUF3822 family protein [Bacteroidales bacterium]|nr:DUF3822 family protein [Bacteroidales bacterium]